MKEEKIKEYKQVLAKCIKDALDPVRVLVIDKLDENSDFFNIICKAELSNIKYKFKNYPMYVFKCTYNTQPSLAILFQLPFKEKSKKLSDKVMGLVSIIEQFFSSIDKLIFRSKKKDKFIYVIVIINLNEEVELWLSSL